MFTRAFWIAAAERAAKTFAQTAATLWGAGAVNIVDVDLASIVGISASAAVVSVLTSLGSVPLSRGESPSLVPSAEVEAAQQW